MKTILLECTQCKTPFERSYKQYKDNNLKKGMKPFCSRSCRQTHTNHNLPKEWYEKHSYKIQQHAANRKDDLSPFKYFLTKCREKKKQKGMEFDVDLHYLKNLWDKQNGICPYTGLKMILPETTRIHSSTFSLKKASLDCIDPSKGYIRGNVEFVCLFINFAKNTYTKDDVIQFIEEMKLASFPKREIITDALPGWSSAKQVI